MAEGDAGSDAARKSREEKLRRRTSFLPGQENTNDLWNNLFKDKSMLRDQVAWENFWTEVKDRLLDRHGNMYQALRKLSSEYGVSIDFTEFATMMGRVGLFLEQRICRAVFEKATNGDKVLYVQGLKQLLLGRTIRKMQETMKGCNNRQALIHARVSTFLTRLALGDPVSASRAVERFKRKLTIGFCREFWRCMMAQLPKPCGPAAAVDFASFERVLKKCDASRSEDGGLQSYEIVFMKRAYYRIQRLHDAVLVCDIVAFMVTLCVDNDCCNKVKLLFDVFDVDYDGCLLWDQLLQMFCCVCRQRPVNEDSCISVSDNAFQQDLSAQEGLHAYECTRWHIQRGTNLEGDIVTLRELWVALSKQLDLMATLFPSNTNVISWLLERTPIEPPDEPASGSTHGPSAAAGTAVAAPAGSGSAAKTGAASSNRGSRLAAVAAEEPKGTMRRTAGAAELRADDEFRGTRTQGFQQSLRGFGVRRLNELHFGFMLYNDPELALAASTGGIDALEGLDFAYMMPSVGASVTGKSGLELPGTPAHEVPPQNSSAGFAKTASSSRGSLGRGQAGRGTRSSIASKDGGMGLSRVGSSPATLGHSSLQSAASHSHSGGPRPPGGWWTKSKEGFLEGVPVIAPSISYQRLGSEAADRFRLFAAVKGGEGNQRLGGGAEKGLTYNCQLCEHPHTFLQEFGR